MLVVLEPADVDDLTNNFTTSIAKEELGTFTTFGSSGKFQTVSTKCT